MMFSFVPPWIVPSVTIRGVVGALKRLEMLWRALMTCAATTMESTPFSGCAPWQEVPFTVMESSVVEAFIFPLQTSTLPVS